MKKMIRGLVILLAILLIPVAVQAQAVSQPHPDPYSGDLSQYEGTWIIDGYDVGDTPWTLEISDGKYTMYNEISTHKGDIVFTPGNEKFDRLDTLWLDFDPDLKIEVVLINLAGGLIDVSSQGLFFVRPGNRIDFDEYEELENYSKKDMVGDWVLDKMYSFILEYGLFVELTNEDIMAGSITGDDRFILSFDKGILYDVSEKLEFRAPITRYRSVGSSYYFEIPNSLSPYADRFHAGVVGKDGLLAEPGQLVITPFPIPPLDDGAELFIYMVFSRLTSADLAEGETKQ